MKNSIRILHLEDNPGDALLVRSSLETAGVSCATTLVNNQADFVTALHAGNIDLILSDNKLPGFDGLAALKTSREISPDAPFIFVSETMGEERAVESLLNGATDDVLKNRLSRLGPAVRRAMKEVEGRAANRQALEALRQSEQRLQVVFSQSPLGIALFGPDGRTVLANPAFQKMLGYTGEELSEMHFRDFAHPDDCAGDTLLYGQLMQGERQNYQLVKRYIRKDGQEVWVRLSVSLAREMEGRTHFAIKMVEDITKQRHLEAQFIEAQKMEVIGQLSVNSQDTACGSETISVSACAFSIWTRTRASFASADSPA